MKGMQGYPQQNYPQRYHEVIDQYGGPLRVWAKAVGASILVHFAVDKDRSTWQTLILLAGILCCGALHEATKLSNQRRKGMLVRNIFFCCGLLQAALHLIYMLEEKATANVQLPFDIGVSLFSITPQLIACFNGAPMAVSILFVSVHVARSFLLNFYLGKMAGHFAILRALIIHTMTVAAALLVLARARALMLSRCDAYQLQQQQQQHQHEKKQQQQQQHDEKQQQHQHETEQQQPQQQQLQQNQQQEKKQQQQQQHEKEQQQQQQQHERKQQQQQQQSYKIIDQQQERNARAMDMQPSAKSSCTRTKSIKDVDRAYADPYTHWTPLAPGFYQPGLQKPDCEEARVLEARCSKNPHGGHNPGLQKSVFEAVRVLEARRSQGAYASKLDQPGNLDPEKRRMRSLQDACRFVVKLNEASTPDDVPEGGLPRLQFKLRKQHQCLAPALRAGCLVISYDASMGSLGCSLEDECAAVLMEANKWAAEQGLLEAAGELLTVQACPHTAWDTLLDGRPSSRYSMALNAPFLIPNPVRHQPAAATVSVTRIGSSIVQEALDMPLQLQHVQALHGPVEQGRAGDEEPQQQPLKLRHEHVQVLHGPIEQGRAGPDQLFQPAHRQEAVCEFELVMCAPPEFDDGVLRGWQGPEDAPEELPEAVKSRSLCLLASLEGQFLRVWVKKESLRSSRERVAQVCVSLPSAFGTPSRCPKALVLELWAVGALVCTYSAILLPCSSAGAAALAELRAWAAERSPDGLPLEDSGPFVRDLVRLMRFGAQTQQRWQQQHTQGGVAATDADLMEERAQKEELCGGHPAAAGSLEITMAAVGMDLLAHSLSRGMEAVAGLLLECLASIPFSVPPSALLDTETLLARLHSLFAREEAAGEEEIETPIKGRYTL